ncbi:MAG: ATP-grasp domain-containing protein [Crocinitomicaceae bacterium]
MTHTYDITILTDHRYVNPTEIDIYTQNVLDEDYCLMDAMKGLGLKVHRTNWDDSNFDWSSTKYVIFRTTWDYFDRFPEFSIWLEKVSKVTKLINPKELIYWNIDKHYLLDLDKQGVRIPNTYFIETGEQRTLSEICSNFKWDEFILKPVVSGAARHTYRFNLEDADKHEAVFKDLIASEGMMIQEFQRQIMTKGEVAFMVFGGKYSHAVLKQAKQGDFRVQDDFGGTISEYKPNAEEIEFIEHAVSACSPVPVYARIDVIWNNENELCIGEIELIEPELWFRMNKNSAQACAQAVLNHVN